MDTIGPRRHSPTPERLSADLIYYWAYELARDWLDRWAYASYLNTPADRRACDHSETVAEVMEQLRIGANETRTEDVR